METGDVVREAFGRIRQLVDRSVAGLDADALAFRPDADANSIGWLVWHLTRTQDDHVAEIAGLDQTWITDGWAERFGMPADPHDTGYGHTSEQVAAVRPLGPDLLTDYHAAVSDRTLEYLVVVDATELDRIIDRSY
ncbi:MAG: DinB family protein, partial [Acidimicrobiia bacterium]|nr:DinB family protein [Acidimicrobiia bacterium]